MGKSKKDNFIKDKFADKKNKSNRIETKNVKKKVKIHNKSNFEVEDVEEELDEN